MEPFMGVVLSAVGTVASGALSGAGGEMGRRTSETLFGLLNRARDEQGTVAAAPGRAAGVRADGAPGGGRAPTLPVTESEQRAAALWLTEVARRSPDFAGEVARWLDEAASLAPGAGSGGAHGAVRPRMLPPATGVFTDREDLTAAVTALLEETGRTRGAPAVAVLSGPGGIGKTAAAVNCAYVLADRFPDGALYVDLAGASAETALAPSDVLVRFLERLGTPSAAVPGDEARQRDLYRDRTAGRRLVIVLDNAHSDAQVLPLLPASPDCLVLVTSRRRLDRLVAGTGARHLTVPPLTPEDSVRLLTRIVGDERTAGAEEGVRAVAEGTGGIPLALCTTGARLAVREHLAWERVARQLSERRTGSGGGDGQEEGAAMPEGTPGDPVRLAHDGAYRELAPECAALYRAVAVWPWPTVTVRCAALAAGVEEGEARLLLEQLADVHLLEEVAPERYRFHDVARAFAHDLAVAEDGHGRMAAAVRRVAVGQLRFAAGADFRVIPSRWRLGPAYRALVRQENRDPEDGKRALQELREERENLAAVVRAAAHHGFDDLVWQLCEAMWGLHLRLGFHEQWVDTHLLGVAAARRSAAEFGDRRAVGRVLVQLAFAYMGLGRAADAERALTQAVAADADCGHHRGQASAVEALGLLHLKQWRWAEAEESFIEAGRVLSRIGQADEGREDLPRARALLEHHTGRAQAKQGRFDEAVDRFNTALVQFRDLPGGADRYNEGRVYMSLGETHLAAGAVEHALVCLDKAVDIMSVEGAEPQLAYALELRADCHRRSGRAEGERADLRATVPLHERGGDQPALARVRARLAELEE
ncbi:NB-ARC domain-containing protein [Streptomyces sp. NPDC004042]|uniref:NB-ARC domain-containing protein n=1 Tax=Streptomyces sp. NPDC004042 TaxID=3154451 RepID=UPI0033B2C360